MSRCFPANPPGIHSCTSEVTPSISLATLTARNASAKPAPWAIVSWWTSSAVVLRIDWITRSEEHTSELQSLTNVVCRLLLEKKTAGTYEITVTDTAGQSSTLQEAVTIGAEPDLHA